jgi:hypothetical protein
MFIRVGLEERSKWGSGNIISCRQPARCIAPEEALKVEATDIPEAIVNTIFDIGAVDRDNGPNALMSRKLKQMDALRSVREIPSTLHKQWLPDRLFIGELKNWDKSISEPV